MKVYFLVEFKIADGTLQAEYATGATTTSTDPTEAKLFKSKGDAEMFALQNDLEFSVQFAKK